ncbi:MAG: glycosyltransferase family 9 protein [Alphaproteobacteria bacterium]|nr:glycosyltransferase family 9 protein [Alphaproteobacteria bacterium]
MTERPKARVLVIKHGALGDFLLSIGPMQAIRRHHPEARLTLLTRPAYRELGEATGLFDDVLADDQPGLANPLGLLRLRSVMRRTGADRIYDLQTSGRTGWYFRLCGPGAPEWSGKVAGSSHRHVYPGDHRMHTIARQRDQLAIAGLQEVPLADLAFLDGDIDGFDLPERIAILIPAASPERPAKCWPPERYAALATALIARGLSPVAVGGTDAAGSARRIVEAAPGTIDLTGRTSLGQLAALARKAEWAVGNDTGPTHLISLAGCPTLALFGGDSDPDKTGPVGPHARAVQAEALEQIAVADVLAAMPSA